MAPIRDAERGERWRRGAAVVTGLGARSLGGGAASVQALAAGRRVGAALEAAADEQAVEAARPGHAWRRQRGRRRRRQQRRTHRLEWQWRWKSGDGTYGLRWLVTVCSAAPPGASAFGLTRRSGQALASRRCLASDDEAAAAVFDLLGEGALEAITELSRIGTSRAAAPRRWRWRQRRRRRAAHVRTHDWCERADGAREGGRKGTSQGSQARGARARAGTASSRAGGAGRLRDAARRGDFARGRPSGGGAGHGLAAPCATTDWPSARWTPPTG